MRSPTSAYRVNVGLNMSSLEGKNLVQSATSNNPQVQVMDRKTYSSTYIFLGFGLEHRRGLGRLQGIYGLEASVSLNSSQSTYAYGNALTVAIPFTSFTIWDEFNANPAFQTSGSSRTVKSSTGTQFSMGVGGFIGAEYFFAPKLSLGGELRLLLRTAPGSSGSATIEYVDFNNLTLNKLNKDLPSGSTNLLLTTVTTGSLNLNIYF
jgi:hypothetical protein